MLTNFLRAIVPDNYLLHLFQKKIVDFILAERKDIRYSNEMTYLRLKVISLISANVSNRYQRFQQSYLPKYLNYKTMQAYKTTLHKGIK